MLVARRDAASEDQQKSLRALQAIITNDLKPDEILDGLKKSREWIKPEEDKLRSDIVGAEYGDPKSQFALGQFLVDTQPVEALKWFRLAQKSKIKEVSKFAEKLEATMDKGQVERAEKMAGEFKPLAP